MVSLEGSFGEWSPITIHLDGEISMRDRSAPYKGGMFAVYPGDIVFSKIDARSGAIGMLPENIGKAVVTPEFPVFVADQTKLVSAFAQRVLRTGGFLKSLRSKATGTSGRKRIQPEAFLSLHIPLPSLEEQQSIVTAHSAALKAASNSDSKADDIESKTSADFEAALGFAPPVALPDKPVLIASFKDLERWSHESVLRRIAGVSTAASSWPIVRLGEVVAGLENGWSPKCLDRPAAPGEWGVLKVSAASSGRYRSSENKALPAALNPRKNLEIRSGDVLVTRASGVAKLVGVASYVEATPGKMMLCDKIFRAKFLEKSPIESSFLAHVLGLQSVRLQIIREFSNDSGMMKNISKPALLSLTFPLPPLDVQRSLVATLELGRAEAARLRAEAKDKRAQAWLVFETSVYANAPTEGQIASFVDRGASVESQSP